MSKKCSVCKEIKNKKQFSKDCSSSDGYYNICKVCDCKKIRTYYRNNKEKVNARDKKYCLTYPEKYLLDSAKDAAKTKKRKFNLELADIVIPKYCPFLKVELTKVCSDSPYAPSVDRIDSTRGYVKGNIQIISELANRMKSNATQEQLLIFSENIRQLYYKSTFTYQTEFDIYMNC